MYYFLAALGSAFISLMVVSNGQLSESCDVFAATTIIHLVGLLFISGVLFLKKENPWKIGRLKKSLFLGGVIGVATTMFNNAAYGVISVSAILALSLFAQAITSLVIDEYGLFHMPVRKFNRSKLCGLLCTLLGIVLLMKGSAFLWIPVVLSLLTGISVVTSRSVNAELAAHTSPLVSTWYNYVIGLVTCLILWIGAAASGYSTFALHLPANPFIYTGGIIGCLVVLILNITVKKMPAFIMTLIMFIGQIFTSILLDILLGAPVSLVSFLGGTLTAVGLVLNLWLDQKSS